MQKLQKNIDEKKNIYVYYVLFFYPLQKMGYIENDF